MRFTWNERMRMEAIACSDENTMGSGISHTRCLLYGMNPFIRLLHPNLGFLCLYLKASCSTVPDDSDYSSRLKSYTSCSVNIIVNRTVSFRCEYGWYMLYIQVYIFFL